MTMLPFHDGDTFSTQDHSTFHYTEYTIVCQMKLYYRVCVLYESVICDILDQEEYDEYDRMTVICLN